MAAPLPVAVDGIEVATYTVPAEETESDGTLTWDSTTAVVVIAQGAGHSGLGYTYGSPAVAPFIRHELAAVVEDTDAMHPQAAWAAMQEAIRNSGRAGLGAMAVSAVDIALWDLKARLLDVPLADLLGRFHDEVEAYGSGGFTSYDEATLRREMAGWVRELGCSRVKMKVGREPDRDPDRLRAVREAIGDSVELFVDANGAFTPKEALAWAERYAEYGVTWLEEPVSSDDRDGLRAVRDGGPPGMEVAAGEYESGLPGLRAVAESVDVLQADVTRCGGVTNMLRADGLCRARSMAFSAHCAPSVSVHVCSAMETARHVEYFHDHARVERLLFDGAATARGGRLRPDPERPGLGLQLKEADAARWEVA